MAAFQMIVRSILRDGVTKMARAGIFTVSTPPARRIPLKSALKSESWSWI